MEIYTLRDICIEVANESEKEVIEGCATDRMIGKIAEII